MSKVNFVIGKILANTLNVVSYATSFLVINYYVLVQRGRVPRKGVWPFQESKVEYGKRGLDAAIR